MQIQPLQHQAQVLPLSQLRKKNNYKLQKILS